MLVGRESSSVDVQIGVDFDRSNMKPDSFQQSTDAARNDSFPDTANYTTSHQNILHLQVVDKIFN